MIEIKTDSLISYYTIEDYCERLVKKVFNILCLKEKNQDYIKPICKIVEELKGATISGIKPFADNDNVLEIIFITSGLTKTDDYKLFRTIVLDCCTLINQLPERLNYDLRKEESI